METNAKTINFELTKEDLANVRIPNARDDTIHKDECCYCFDTPESGTPGNAEDGGLLICLHDFLCFCPRHAHLHWEKTHHHLYLHTRTLRFLKTSESEKKESEAAETKPTVLGIGVPGGFPTEDSKYRVEEKYALVKIPLGDRLPLDVTPPEYTIAVAAAANNSNYDIPEVIRTAVASILKARSSEAKDELAEWKATEDAAAGPLPVSKFAEGLKQEPCGEQQQRGQDGKWHCEHPGCTFTDNLWFNLGDGSVLCGRANFIGLGNNHALQHYKENPCGDRSLVVKVGTITPTEAEVYSYSEDDMVRDPLLAQHLAHFGIDRAKLTKTGRTMDELTLDVNSKYEFSRIAANEKGAKPAFGPGHTGILNLGNSCYLASVMQAIFSNEAFINTFGTPAAAERIFREGPVDPTNDLRCQLAKLGTGLISGKYAVPTPLAVGEEEEEGEGDDRAQVGIRPRSFKSLIGRIDPTFASKAQQDASEFFISFLRAVERSQREGGANGVGEAPLCEQYTTNVEERLECGETHRVRYSWRSERVIPLAIPLELATNKLEVATTEALTATGFNVNNVEPPRLNVPFDAVLECAFGTPEYIDGFRSPATGNITQAIKTVRFATFPEHLVLMLTRHVFDENFQPKKINASVPVPDVIDLDAYRGLGGLQEGEEYLATLVKGPPPQAPKRAEVKPNETVVAALLDMGFPAVTAKFAALSTGNNDVEAAAAWLFEHIEDAITQDDLDALLARLNGNGDAVEAPKFGPCEIAMITSMGFTEKHAALALKSTDGNVERAIDWVLSRLDDLDRLVLADEQKQQKKKKEDDEEEEKNGEERSEEKKDDDKDDDEVNLAPPPAKFPKNTASSKYELYGIIPHIGKTTNSGHYVAYVKKDGKWISFNDSKVAFVDEPPRDMGFLYFFKRI